MSKRKGESYLGGHSIIRTDPVGTRDQVRVSKSAKQAAKADLEIYAANLLLRKEQRKKERIAELILTVRRSDRFALGFYSGSWSSFRHKLRQELYELKIGKIVRPDLVARALNAKNFRTCAGQFWNDRLVRIAKRAISGKALVEGVSI